MTVMDRRPERRLSQVHNFVAHEFMSVLAHVSNGSNRSSAIATRYGALLGSSFRGDRLSCILVHNFWTMEGPARAANASTTSHKDLALVGGLLLLFVTGGGLLASSTAGGKKT